MKSWRFFRVYETYAECLVQAETLEEARELTQDESEWEELDCVRDLARKGYQVVESTSDDVADDYDALREAEAVYE